MTTKDTRRKRTELHSEQQFEPDSERILAMSTCKTRKYKYLMIAENSRRWKARRVSNAFPRKIPTNHGVIKRWRPNKIRQIITRSLSAAVEPINISYITSRQFAIQIHCAASPRSSEWKYLGVVCREKYLPRTPMRGSSTYVCICFVKPTATKLLFPADRNRNFQVAAHGT